MQENSSNKGLFQSTDVLACQLGIMVELIRELELGKGPLADGVICSCHCAIPTATAKKFGSHREDDDWPTAEQIQSLQTFGRPLKHNQSGTRAPRSHSRLAASPIPGPSCG
jgi:hypothetical protein